MISLLKQLIYNAVNLPITLLVIIKEFLVVSYDWLIVGREELAHIVCKPTARNEYVLAHCSSFKSKYKPLWWAVNGHLETMAATQRNRERITKHRELINLEDGGTVGLDWLVSVGGSVFQESHGSVLLLVLPGLTAGHGAYAGLCKFARKKNMLPIIFIKRGHAGLKLTSPKLQSFGDTSDFRYCVCYLKEKFPQKCLMAIGYSAGTGILAQYMGEYREDPIILAGVLTSPGYDCDKQYGEGGFRQPYNWIMTRQVKRKIVEPNQNELAKVVDLKKVMSSRNLREFETYLYSDMHGYSDIDEYFIYNNPARIVHKGSIPYLCISSLNDPVCIKEYIPFDFFLNYENSILLLTKRGGHCGWIESGTNDTWADKVAVDFLQTVQDFEAKHE